MKTIPINRQTLSDIHQSLILACIFTLASVGHSDDLKQSVSTADALSCLAGDSFDSMRVIQLELTRAEAIKKSTSERYEKLMDYKAKGVTYGRKIIEVERQKAKAEAYANTLSEARGFFNDNLETVWASWGKNLEHPTSPANFVMDPQLSFQIGGHVVFSRAQPVTREILNHGKNYLTSFKARNTQFNPYTLQLNSTRLFRDSLRLRGKVKSSDLRLLNGQVFETGYQVETWRIDDDRLQRDLDRVSRALSTDRQPSMPHLATSIPGLGTGWRKPLPLNEDALKETLPLAIAKAEQRGQFNSAWINIVASAKRLKELHKQKRDGAQISDSKLTTAREKLLLNRNLFLKVRKELEIRWDEMNLLATLSGVDNFGLQTVSADTERTLRNFNPTELVLACKDSPTDFCGATKIYTELVIAKATEKVAALEVNYRYEEQQRLAKSKYFKESELREATFSYESAKADLLHAREQLSARKMELRQWSSIQTKNANPTDTNWVLIMQPTMMAKAKQISEKRQELDRMNFVQNNLLNDLSQLSLVANGDIGMKNFEQAISKGTVGELDRDTMQILLSQLKINNNSHAIISKEVEKTVAQNRRIEADNQSRLAIAD